MIHRLITGLSIVVLLGGLGRHGAAAQGYTFQLGHSPRQVDPSSPYTPNKTVAFAVSVPLGADWPITVKAYAWFSTPDHAYKWDGWLEWNVYNQDFGFALSLSPPTDPAAAVRIAKGTEAGYVKAKVIWGITYAQQVMITDPNPVVIQSGANDLPVHTQPLYARLSISPTHAVAGRQVTFRVDLPSPVLSGLDVADRPKVFSAYVWYWWKDARSYQIGTASWNGRCQCLLFVTKIPSGVRGSVWAEAVTRVSFRYPNRPPRHTRDEITFSLSQR